MDLGSAGNFDLNGVLEISDAWALRDLKLSLNVPDMDVPLFWRCGQIGQRQRPETG